jgi:hypothetical protein
MRLQPILYGIAGTLFIGSAVSVGVLQPDPGVEKLLYALAAIGAVLAVWAETSGEGWIDARGVHLFNLKYIKVSLSAFEEDIRTGKDVTGRELAPSEIEAKKREVRDLLAQLNRAQKAGMISDVTYANLEEKYQPLFS